MLTQNHLGAEESDAWAPLIPEIQAQDLASFLQASVVLKDSQVMVVVLGDGWGGGLLGSLLLRFLVHCYWEEATVLAFQPCQAPSCLHLDPDRHCSLHRGKEAEAQSCYVDRSFL